MFAFRVAPMRSAAVAGGRRDITGLGLDADWFPPATLLMTTDGTRLITVKVTWNAVPQTRMIALAEATARAYLRETTA